MFDILESLDANLNYKKVDIVTFCESQAFCGRALYPRQKLLLKLLFLEDLTDAEERILDYWIEGGRNKAEIQVSPYIRERIAWLKANGYDHFREMILVGGRRSSKGFTIGLAMAKLMYDFLALQDPNQHFGIDRNKEIYFACVASSQDQAKKYQYADFSSAVNSCVAMQPYIRKLQELEFSVATETDLREIEKFKRQGRRVQRDLAKLRGVAWPANAGTIRGGTTAAIVFDEMAHLQDGGSFQSAGEVYEAAKPSLDQFGRAAALFLSSSPYTKIGKFYERFEEAMAVANAGPSSPEMFALRMPSWSLFEAWGDDPTYRGPKHSITVSPDWDPDRRRVDDSYYYCEEDRSRIVQMRNEERQEPQKFKIERRAQWAEVVDAYLIPEMVDRMFMGRPLGGGKYELLRSNFTDGDYRFKYMIHIDPSSTTAGFGFALGHVETLEVDGNVRDHTVFDVLQRWNPADFGGVIDWEPILKEVFQYAQYFQPYQITMDQYNSSFPISWLRRELRKVPWGQPIRVLEKTSTAQANWDQAEIFRTALYMDLVHAPYDTGDCAWASEELKYLQEIRSSRIPRVDKQDAGAVTTCDIADSAFSIVESLIGNSIAKEVREDLLNEPLRVGAGGGYSIGGNERLNGRPLLDSSGRDLYSTRTGEQKMFGSSFNRDKARIKNRLPARGARFTRRKPF